MEEITFSKKGGTKCGKEATLSWDLDWWQWVEGYHFLDYTSKLGRDSIINRILDMTKKGGQMAR